MKKKLSKVRPRQTLYRIFISMTIGVFISDFFAHYFHTENIAIHILLDILFLLLISSPIVYFWAYRGLRNKVYSDEKLIQDFKKYELIVEKSMVAAYILDHGRFVYVSPNFSKILGISREKIYEIRDMVKCLEMVLDEESISKITYYHGQRLKGLEAPNHYVLRGVKLDGKPIVVEVFVSTKELNKKEVTVGKIIDVTEKGMIEQELIKSESKLNQAQAIAEVGSWELDFATYEMKCSEQTYKILGIPPKENLLLRQYEKMIHPEDKESYEKKLEKNIKSKGPFNLTYRIIRPDGKIRTVQTISKPSVDTEGKPNGLVGTIQDITKSLAFTRKLENSENRLRSLFEYNLDGVLAIDLNGIRTDANLMYQSITGYSRDEIIGTSFVPAIHPDDLEKTLIAKEDTIKGYPQRFHLRFFNKRKEVRDADISTMPIYEGNDIVGLYAIVRDITEQKRHNELIQTFAYQDFLTKLPNRRRLKEELTTAFQKAKETDSKVAILYIDLDRLKLVNDNLGHEAGDLLIKCSGERLVECTRSDDIVARLGGDEFAILIKDFENEHVVIQVAERIVSTFKEPFNIDSQIVQSSASIGISFYPEHGSDEEDLIQKADTAMYYVKSKGKGNYRVYEPWMNENVESKFALQNSFRKSLENNEFFLMFQPKVDVKGNKITSIESLVRWNYPGVGMISPAEFIPLAEETGFIVELGEWIIEKAIEGIRYIHRIGLTDIKICVNISATQFQYCNLAKSIERLLKTYNVSPQCLELEITEGLLMNNDSYILNNLKLIKNMGLKLAIDDFGTGYSSFAYLKKFRIDTLKIDQSFIRNIHENKENAAIVAAMINLAHDLDMTVVTEGVETNEELDFVTMLGSDEVQGFFISKPLTTEGICSFLRNEKSEIQHVKTKNHTLKRTKLM